MAKKFYVVWAGRETGVFSDWAVCKRSIDKFSGARYKSYPTKAEADAAYSGGPGTSGGKRAGSSSGGASSKAGPKRVTAPHAMGAYNVEVYCDGGCDPNPGRAGSGVAVYRDGSLADMWYGLYNANGTNNTAELNALHQSLMIAEEAINENKTVAIYCDSMYSINCISVWAFSWKKKGWKKPTGEIKNLEMIKEIHELYIKVKAGLELCHVKAHVGIEGNELADRMTMIAVDRKELKFSQFDDDLDIKTLLNLRAG